MSAPQMASARITAYNAYLKGITHFARPAPLLAFRAPTALTETNPKKIRTRTFVNSQNINCTLSIVDPSVAELQAVVTRPFCSLQRDVCRARWRGRPC